jgi:hypothetical protein
MGRLLARSSADGAFAWAGDGLDAEAAAVWERGYVMAEKDPFFFRLDELGNEIHRWAHANAASPFGWQKDLVVPAAFGGDGHITNLRPLHLRAFLPPPCGEVEAQSASGGGSGGNDGEGSHEVLASEV